MSSSYDSSLLQTVKIEKRHVFLISSDGEFTSVLNHQISHFGYSIQVFKDIKSLQVAAAEHACLAILVDMPSIESSLAEQDFYDAFQEIKHSAIPMIFISDSAEQSVRLKAVRSGGIAFLTKPIDVIRLVDILDQQDVIQESDPYRVLVVEDQVSVANYYQMVLKMAGIETRIVLDPNQALGDILEFHPDLILMDLYMPDVNGAELATLLRQMEEFVSIPIVFLSSEDDFSKHIEMMSLGSDDFLTKPIKANHLVALVKSRLERLKNLRKYMVRDSLTGLLNHTSFHSVLTQEVNRCRRQCSTIALAMLDVDHFKQVNDTFGHSAGDSVLKGLSRLLKQRLRKSDIIGRYGGEEFVALFLDADPEQAFRVIDELRIHFMEMEFQPAPDKILQVTFSAGIAAFPAFSTAKELSDAADEAMYLAKKTGRNRIVIAAPERVNLR